MTAAQGFLDRGASVYRVLTQDKVWRDNDGVLWSLEDMDPDHRRNLIRWLRRHAPGLVSAAYWGAASFWGGLAATIIGEHALDDVEASADAEAEEMLDNPEAWLERTPLMRRLVDLSPPPPPRPLPPLPGELEHLLSVYRAYSRDMLDEDRGPVRVAGTLDNLGPSGDEGCDD